MIKNPYLVLPADDRGGSYSDITLLDLFAGFVLAGIMTGDSEGKVLLPEKTAGLSYLYAEAMLEERLKIKSE